MLFIFPATDTWQNLISRNRLTRVHIHKTIIRERCNDFSPTAAGIVRRNLHFRRYLCRETSNCHFPAQEIIRFRQDSGCGNSQLQQLSGKKTSQIPAGFELARRISDRKSAALQTQISSSCVGFRPSLPFRKLLFPARRKPKFPPKAKKPWRS